VPDVVRYGLIVLAALTIGLAALAMLGQDDLGRFVASCGSAAIAPAVLAFCTDTPDLVALRTLLIVGVTGATALAAWSASVRLISGARRNSGSVGWLRRYPALGLILVFIVAGMTGWPGTAIWEARQTLVDGAVTGPLATAILIALVVAALAPLRQLGAGARRAEPPFGMPGPWRPLLASLLALALSSVPLILDAAGPAFRTALASPIPFTGP